MRIIKGKGPTGPAFIYRVLRVLSQTAGLDALYGQGDIAFPLSSLPVNYKQINGEDVYFVNYDLLEPNLGDLIGRPAVEQSFSVLARASAYNAGQLGLTDEEAEAEYSPVRVIAPENEALYQYPGQVQVGARLLDVATGVLGTEVYPIAPSGGVVLPGGEGGQPVPEGSLAIMEYGAEPIEP